MKVLFDHPDPFLLAHGGFQRQIEMAKDALNNIGVDVEWLRFWDDEQKADLIHYFGRPPGTYVDFAHQKGMKVAMLELLTGLGSRSTFQRKTQKAMIHLARQSLPASLVARMSWDAYAKVDLVIANTDWEAFLMQDMFGAPSDRVRVIANGVESVFLDSPVVPRGKWLVCTATITERKRTLELARAAVRAGTPLWVIGRPYSENDPYALAFQQWVQRYPEVIRYEGAISERAKLASIYREARGFVLLSTMETLSLSSFEAAACECPLLVSKLPWAWSAFKNEVQYCPITDEDAETASHLKAFYEKAPQLKPPTRPKTWKAIAEEFRAAYEEALSRP